MKRLSLNTGLSYSIRGFSCVKGEPFEVEDGLAEQLLATGRFDEQPVIANPAEESAQKTKSRKLRRMELAQKQELRTD